MSDRLRSGASDIVRPHAGDRVSSCLLSYFDAAVARHPNKTAVVVHGSRGRISLCYADLARHVMAIAASFRALGLKRGSVVSYQLPNWWEAIAIHLAALRIGAISNPLMPFLRERDLAFMLALAESDILITPAMFRGHDHQQMARDLQLAVPGLRHIRVIGGDDDVAFEKMLAAHERGEAEVSIEPEDVVQYLFTSGTTGEPKCVMHSRRSLLAMVGQAAERLRMSDSDVVFMAMPLAHQGGFISGVVLPVMLGATAILQDEWSPARAVDIFATEHVTMTLGATPFLSDMTDEVAKARTSLPDLRIFVTAGAPIPRALVERARSTLGCSIVPSWGMSENGFVTMVAPDDPEIKVASTDGYALPLMDVRVVNDANVEVGHDCEGRLQVRGPNLFSGYLKRPHFSELEPGGWFDTGDLARMDDEGYIRITGRTKDIVIRGGENIPVVEIEQVMFRHPAVDEFAIVGMPDDRLGERLCAFAVLRPSQTLSLSDMRTYLGAEGVAKSYWPEHLACVAAMPRTPTGKIQKFVLRDEAKAIAASINKDRDHGKSEKH